MAYSTREVLSSILAVALTFTAHVVGGGVNCTLPGIVYVELLGAFPDQPSGVVAVAVSLSSATTWAIGPVAGFLTNRFGPRAVTIAGGLLSSLGLILSAFATSIYHIQAAFGGLVGVGIGMGIVPAITVIGLYFDKRRPLAFGLSAAGVGFGNFAFPPLLRYFIDQYSWRGALLLTGGLCLHVCLAGVCLGFLDLRQPTKLDPDESSNRSCTSLLNFQVFKHTSFICLCLNNALIMFGIGITYVHLAAYAMDLGFSSGQASVLYSAIGIADIGGRVTWGLIAHIPRVSTVSVYALSYLTLGVVTHLSSYVRTYPLLMSYAVSFGLFSGCLGALMPTLLVEILGVDLLTSGFGYVLIFNAIGILFGPPCAGWLYDHTENYKTSLYLGSAAFVLSSLLMTHQWFCDKNTQLTVHMDEEKAAKEMEKESQANDGILEHKELLVEK